MEKSINEKLELIRLLRGALRIVLYILLQQPRPATTTFPTRSYCTFVLNPYAFDLCYELVHILKRLIFI